MKRILVIDDNLSVRELLVDAFESVGYVVTEAGDGREGIKAVREQVFDLVITDLYMPEKEGIETIMELRREFPGMKIMAISGGPADQLKMAKLLGANRIIEKPFDIPALLINVHSLLEE